MRDRAVRARASTTEKSGADSKIGRVISGGRFVMEGSDLSCEEGIGPRGWWLSLEDSEKIKFLKHGRAM